MRTGILILPLSLSLLACGDDDGGTPTVDAAASDAAATPSDAAAAPDATATPSDAGGPPADGGTATADAGPGSVERLFDQLVAYAAEDCACNSEAYGYPTEALCTSVNSFSPLVRECFISSAAAVPDIAEATSCFGDGTETVASCLEAASCDEAATEACDDAYDTSLDACPMTEALAALFTATGTCLAGAEGTCPDSSADAGAMGAEVFSGLTIGGGDNFVSTEEDPCESIAPDRAHGWTAPTAGDWVIDTAGSDYDTVLAVYNSCDDGTRLACNDDVSDDVLTSETSLNLEEGQSILIVVDGFDGTSGGNYVVNINPADPL